VQKILVTGASGFIGRAVVGYFKRQGYPISRLVRSSRPQEADAIYWNPITEEIHLDELEGFHAVIHLAGKNISEKRWTARVKEEIFLSRVRHTWLLAHALSRLKRPPKLFFSASAVGYYGDRGDEVLTEACRKGRGFLADVCQKWEEASQVLDAVNVRVVRARFGAVLSPEGGILGRLMPLFKWGLGAKFASGKQWMSWIALDDLLKGLDFCLTHPEMRGVYNFTSPHPVTNEEFTTSLAKAVHRPAIWTIPRWAISVLGGQGAKELLLASTRAIPERLLKSGFVFQKPDLDAVYRNEDSPQRHRGG
jgi:uncharacterized protein